MRINLKIFLVAVLASLITLPTVLFSASLSDTELYNTAIECSRKLNRAENFTGNEANWLQCINKFRLVYMMYADTRLIDDVLLNLGDLYFALYGRSKKEKYLNSALGAFRELYYYYPESKYAPRATLAAGDIYFKNLKQYKKAYETYGRLVEYYGSGGQAREAARRLKDLSRYYTPTLSKRASRPDLALLKDVRHWTNPRYTRLVIDLNNSVSYEKHVLKNPDRLFIDLHGARISSEFIGRPITINDGLLKRVRVGQHDKDTVRVVVDIDRIERYKIFELDNPFRVIIDVSGSDKKRRYLSADGSGKKEQGKGSSKLSLARQLGLGIETIVIDPGHGGKDPGAIGPSGLMEKDIVLDIARRLKKIIEEKTGRRAYLTRYNDVFLPLEERTAIANTLEADLFVSLHVNANYDSKIRGVETYYLNLATTQEEQRIAAMENRTSFKKVSDLDEILSSIMLNSKIDESRALARTVQSSLVRGLNGSYRSRDLGVKKAPFYVLIGAQMPSVLAEMAFITNKREERLLASTKYRQAVANRIYRGLEAYIDQMKAQSSLASK